MFFLIEGIEDGTKGVLGISPLTSLGMMISFILIWVQAYKNRNQSLKELKKEVSKRAFIELYYVNFRLFVVLAGTFWLASILFLLTKDAFVVILFTMAMGVCSFEIPNLSRFLKQLQVKKEDRKRLMRGESIE